MRIKIQEVDVIGITRFDVERLVAELNKLQVALNATEYPMLNKLRKLLANNFMSSYNGIHELGE